ncbi:MAG: mechanosensitive ion channel family protein [Tepidisphaerales bacterium]
MAAPAPVPPPSTEILSPEFSQFLLRMAVEWSGKLLAVLGLLIGAWVLGFYVRRAIGKAFERSKIDQTLGRFLGNVVRWLIFVMGVVACLGLFGFNITSVAALVGAAGLTVGLALQGSLSNLAAGLMLMLTRPFKVGDFVNVAGQLGRVDDIDLFNTKIDTPDNRRLIVPNGQIFNQTIENITHHAWRRADVPVGVAYSSDLKVVRAALRRAAESIPQRDPAKPVDVLLQGFGANSIDWTVRIWVPAKEFFPCRDRLVERMKEELDAAGISIPFPQLELWFRNRLETSAAEPVPGTSRP